MIFRNGNEFTFIGEIYNVKPSKKQNNLVTCGGKVNATGNNQNDFLTFCGYDGILNGYQNNDVVLMYGYINKGGVPIIQAIQKYGHIVHKQKSQNQGYNNNQGYNQGYNNNQGYNQGYNNNQGQQY